MNYSDMLSNSEIELRNDCSNAISKLIKSVTSKDPNLAEGGEILPIDETIAGEAGYFPAIDVYGTGVIIKSISVSNVTICYKKRKKEKRESWDFSNESVGVIISIVKAFESWVVQSYP